METMIKDKETNIVYANRKEAKTLLGHAAYNKKVRMGAMEYIITSHKPTDVIL